MVLGVRVGFGFWVGVGVGDKVRNRVSGFSTGRVRVRVRVRVTPHLRGHAAGQYPRVRVRAVQYPRVPPTPSRLMLHPIP